jgi:hypothetical protein
MENRIQYGPYSPQEVERISVWLKENNVRFELTRNDQEAKEALMNDGQNVVSLAEFRTNIYLAQVFYVALIESTESIQKKFEELFTLKDEVFPPSKRQIEGEDQLVHEGNLKHQQKKRNWARVLSLLYIVPILISFYYLFFKES